MSRDPLDGPPPPRRALGPAVLVVPASERLTAWPQMQGQVMLVHNPAAVWVRPGVEAPAWETARRLVEDDA